MNIKTTIFLAVVLLFLAAGFAQAQTTPPTYIQHFTSSLGERCGTFSTHPSSVYQLQCVGNAFDVENPDGSDSGVLAGGLWFYNVLNWHTTPPDFGITGTVTARKYKVNYDNPPFIDQNGIQQPGSFQVVFQEQMSDGTFHVMTWSAEWINRVGGNRSGPIPYVISGQIVVDSSTVAILD